MITGKITQITAKSKLQATLINYYCFYSYKTYILVYTYMYMYPYAIGILHIIVYNMGNMKNS